MKDEVLVEGFNGGEKGYWWVTSAL